MAATSGRRRRYAPATTMKVKTVPTLTKTTARLKRADSLMPTTRIVVTARTAAKAGTLKAAVTVGREAVSTPADSDRRDRLPAILKEYQDGAGSVGEAWWKVETEVLEEAHHVRAPSGGDGRRAEGVLQDQIPADDPGEDLAERRVAVGIGGARDGDEGRELGVAQPGESTSEPREDEG